MHGTRKKTTHGSDAIRNTIRKAPRTYHSMTGMDESSDAAVVFI